MSPKVSRIREMFVLAACTGAVHLIDAILQRQERGETIDVIQINKRVNGRVVSTKTIGKLDGSETALEWLSIAATELFQLDPETIARFDEECEETAERVLRLSTVPVTAIFIASKGQPN